MDHKLSLLGFNKTTGVCVLLSQCVCTIKTLILQQHRTKIELKS